MPRVLCFFFLPPTLTPNFVSGVFLSSPLLSNTASKGSIREVTTLVKPRYPVFPRNFFCPPLETVFLDLVLYRPPLHCDEILELRLPFPFPEFFLPLELVIFSPQAGRTRSGATLRRSLFLLLLPARTTTLPFFRFLMMHHFAFRLSRG